VVSFQASFTASANTFYFCWLCTYIVFIL
jgi:hypothetical protein